MRHKRMSDFDRERLLAVGLLRLLMRTGRDGELVEAIAAAYGIDLTEWRNTGAEVTL